jgi:hypothetical protein
MVRSSTYSSKFVVAAWLQITVTRSMRQSPAFWKREKKVGSTDCTKSDYISFAALMISMHGSCSAHARVLD